MKTVNEIKDKISGRNYVDTLGYVRVNGEYRFAQVSLYGQSYKDLAGGDEIESAGFLQIRPDRFSINGHSTTLCAYPDRQDCINFSALFGLPNKSDWADYGRERKYERMLCANCTRFVLWGVIKTIATAMLKLSAIVILVVALIFLVYIFPEMMIVFGDFVDTVNQSLYG